ncbi:ATP-binding cassette domain-containing protein [Peptostreptococcus sp. D1]|uniref:ATP-binding cassette domain-containing protein n=1 Tax=Peptostreptococcus sp. D1 TaxID=72304 RepID=UPI0008E3C1AA|nr:ATP-binding cassette domain-containing protein [Peptostreptococcus sp. D1]SFE74783.1 putative ABC transport system ATP-binding protein [Peptostreptococcus sp. D1]
MQKEKELQITLRNISKKYGNHSILKNISLDIYQGDFVCIFGKSGCGKTTLLNIMGTLENYDMGKVICFSKNDPVRSDKASEYLRRMNIAYLFQNFALVEKMTVEENMMLAIKYNSQKDKKTLIINALNKMGVANKLKFKVYELSGGEQQRVALARNMVKPFDIMLADEPTGSLDSENKRIVIDTLIKLNREGKTIVVVSHDRDFEKVAHKSYIIENGSLKGSV